MATNLRLRYLPFAAFVRRGAGRAKAPARTQAVELPFDLLTEGVCTESSGRHCREFPIASLLARGKHRKGAKDG